MNDMDMQDLTIKNILYIQNSTIDKPQNQTAINSGRSFKIFDKTTEQWSQLAKVVATIACGVIFTWGTLFISSTVRDKIKQWWNEFNESERAVKVVARDLNTEVPESRADNIGVTNNIGQKILNKEPTDINNKKPNKNLPEEEYSSDEGYLSLSDDEDYQDFYNEKYLGQDFSDDEDYQDFSDDDDLPLAGKDLEVNQQINQEVNQQINQEVNQLNQEVNQPEIKKIDKPEALKSDSFSEMSVPNISIDDSTHDDSKTQRNDAPQVIEQLSEAQPSELSPKEQMINVIFLDANIWKNASLNKKVEIQQIWQEMMRGADVQKWKATETPGEYNLDLKKEIYGSNPAISIGQAVLKQKMIVKFSEEIISSENEEANYRQVISFPDDGLCLRVGIGWFSKDIPLNRILVQKYSNGNFVTVTAFGQEVTRGCVEVCDIWKDVKWT